MNIFLSANKKKLNQSASWENLEKWTICLHSCSMEAVRKTSSRNNGKENTIHKEVITDNISVVGAYYSGRFTETEMYFRNCWTVGNCVLFNRVCVGNQLIHSKQCKTTRRNNTIIRYSKMHFGQVEHFIKVKTQCPPRCTFLCVIASVFF